MTLALEQTGSGIPIIFIHAFPLARGMWKPQLPISKNFRMITVDLPGFGESPAGKPIMKMDETARAVMRMLDDRNMNQPAIFVGLSMGGYVLLQILRLFPQRVRAAVLASTRAGADSPEGRAKRLENVALVEGKGGVSALAEKMIPALLGESTRQERPEVADVVRGLIRAQPAVAITAGLSWNGRAIGHDPGFGRHRLPVFAHFWAEDAIIPSVEMEEMAKKIPKGEFEKIEKAGHLVNLEAPDLFNDAFSHFLKRRVL